MTDKPVIFLAFANDRQDGNRYLRNLPDELRRVRERLRRAEKAGLCEVVVKTNTTVGELLDTFQEYRNRVAVFHFGGHAGGFQLLLESAEGHPEFAHAEGLAEFLGQQRGLQLVFLNGCSTQPQVEGLLAAGIPAVVATSQFIVDEIATALSTRFYNALAGGASIGTAFSESVAAVKTGGGNLTRAEISSAGKDNDDTGRHRHVVVIDTTNGRKVTDRWPWELYVKEGAELVRAWNLPKAAGDPLYGLPTPPQLDLPVKPYRHLQWFTRNEAELFFGRGREIRDLYMRITAEDGAPIILFYGASGVGKSSILAAGLLPRLEQTHEVLYLRRDAATGLSGTLEEGLVSHSRPKALSSVWELAGKPLPEHIEQLEEAIQHQEREKAAQQVAGLERLLDEIKASLRADREAGSIAEAWNLRESATGKPLVILLDQAEEAFTRQSPILAEEEFQAFLAEMQALFKSNESRPRGRLILSFRKEWSPDIIARFEEAGLFFSRVFMERLDLAGTKEAIEGIAKTHRLQQHYGLSVEDGLAHEIAEDLLADPDSPLAPTLQILLTKMWDAAKKRSRELPPHFDQALYHKLKDQGILLNDFLNEQLKALQEWNNDVVESGLALDVLVYHTTPLGTAQRLTMDELEAAYSHQKGVLPNLIRECENKYLLVTVTSMNEAGETQTSTRLAHDTLAPLVRRQFDQSDAPGQRALRILQNRAGAWEGDKTGEALDEVDLNAVESGKEGMRGWSGAEQRLIAASRVAQERRQRNRRTWRMVGLAAIVAIVFLAGFSLVKMQEAQESQEAAMLEAENAARSQAAAEEKEKEAIKESIRSSWLATLSVDRNQEQFRFGVRDMYRYISPIFNLVRLKAIAPFPVFTSGPHEEDFDLESELEFGRYNPEFVQWAEENLIPGADDEALRMITAPVYSRFGRSLVRAYYYAHQDLINDPEVFRYAVERYEAALEAGAPESFNPGMSLYQYENAVCGSLDWDYVTGDTVSDYVGVGTWFWIRRELDGTRESFFAMLQKLLNTYDPSWEPESPLGIAGRIRSAIAGSWGAGDHMMTFYEDGRVVQTESGLQTVSTWELVQVGDGTRFDGFFDLSIDGQQYSLSLRPLSYPDCSGYQYSLEFMAPGSSWQERTTLYRM